MKKIAALYKGYCSIDVNVAWDGEEEVVISDGGGMCKYLKGIVGAVQLEVLRDLCMNCKEKDVIMKLKIDLSKPDKVSEATSLPNLAEVPTAPGGYTEPVIPEAPPVPDVPAVPKLGTPLPAPVVPAPVVPSMHELGGTIPGVPDVPAAQVNPVVPQQVESAPVMLNLAEVPALPAVKEPAVVGSSVPLDKRPATEMASVGLTSYVGVDSEGAGAGVGAGGEVMDLYGGGVGGDSVAGIFADLADPTATLNIDALLESELGLAGGPSEGGFSIHTLEECKCWRSAYYTHILGMVPLSDKMTDALQFGSLYHACWECWQRFGGRYAWNYPCEIVRRAGGGVLAGRVEKLFDLELRTYGNTEAAEWDFRALEQNAVFWEPTKIEGKTVYLPFSCRHDALVAKKVLGVPNAPFGPVASGISVVDRKTASSLSRNAIEKYALDTQFLMNALVYKRSGEVEQFGPLTSMIFTIAAKHVKPTAARSLARVETMVEDWMLDEFFHGTILPRAIEFYKRLKSCRGDRNLWPKDYMMCMGSYGKCKYYDVCDGDNDLVLQTKFKVDEARIFTLDRLAEPPAAVKSAYRADVVAADPKAADKAAARETKAAMRRDCGLRALSLLLENLQAEFGFVRSKFVAAESRSSERDVKKLIRTELISVIENEGGAHIEDVVDGIAYVITSVESPIGFPWVAEVVNSTVDKKGRKQTFKGKLSLKAVIDSMSSGWWDIETLDPKVIEDEAETD